MRFNELSRLGTVMFLYLLISVKLLLLLMSAKVYADEFSLVDWCGDLKNIETMKVVKPKESHLSYNDTLDNTCYSAVDISNCSDDEFLVRNSNWFTKAYVYFKSDSIKDLEKVDVEISMIYFELMQNEIKVIDKKITNYTLKKKAGETVLMERVKSMINAPKKPYNTSVPELHNNRFLELKFRINNSNKEYLVTNAIHSDVTTHTKFYFLVWRKEKCNLYSFDDLSSIYYDKAGLSISSLKSNKQYLSRCSKDSNKYGLPYVKEMYVHSRTEHLDSSVGTEYPENLKLLFNEHISSKNNKLNVNVREIVTERNKKGEYIFLKENITNLVSEKDSETGKFTLNAKDVFKDLYKEYKKKFSNKERSFWIISFVDGRVKKEFKIGGCNDETIHYKQKKKKQLEKKTPQAIKKGKSELKFVRYCDLRVPSNRLVRYKRNDISYEEFKSIGYEKDVCLDVTSNNEFSVKDLEENGIDSLTILRTNTNISPSNLVVKAFIYGKDYKCSKCDGSRCVEYVEKEERKLYEDLIDSEDYYGQIGHDNKSFYYHIGALGNLVSNPYSDLSYIIKFRSANKEFYEINFNLGEKYVTKNVCVDYKYKF